MYREERWHILWDYRETESVGSGDRLHMECEKPSRVLWLIPLGAWENASTNENKAKEQTNKQNMILGQERLHLACGNVTWDYPESRS